MATSKTKRTSKPGASDSHVTTNHNEIRKWVEARGGQPACVKGTGDSNDPGVLRIDFPGYSGEESLQHMDWDDWFDKFDCAHLAMIYQEKTKDGHPSRFAKLVNRENSGGGSKRKSSARHGRSAR